ncbi:MAG: LysM peptidoglycan-binding domain-containing protein [Anaerolineae bacterium]|nr:LysM peptidoglycan-binding domain-containing protein [Thermoflexales bacterium]MDW8407323.1 LysM peptidoglycan-binding domain-containing protein [Anaerolineae bacterium]
MDRQDALRRRWFGRAIAALLAAGGVASCAPATPSPTVDVAAMQALAATTLASIPTAAPLTPRPATRTPTVAATPTQPVEAREMPTPPSPVVRYVVQAGDTLLAIAYRHNVSMAAIQLANDMGESQIVRLGDTLTIPSEKIAPDENAFWILHIVRPAQTLSAIAQLYGVSMAALARVNQIADPDAIHVGQKLIVPLTGLYVAAEPTARPQRPTEVAAPAAGNPAAPAKPPTAQPPAPPIVYSDIGGAEAMRARLLELHNAERVAAGVPPLVISAVLQQAAQLHAQDCAVRGYGSHIGSDGSTARVRIARAGYAGRITGENWAFGRSVERVFDMWFHQEYPNGPHRLNILSPRYTEVGFGIAEAGNGGFYFIANFGAP